MFNNLFNRFYFYSLITIFLFDILSFISHQYYLVNYFSFILIILLVFILTLKRLEWGIYILLTELFIGSKGYLFFIYLFNFRLSIRIGLFITILIVYLIRLLLRKNKLLFNKSFIFYYPYLILLLFIIIGTINGLAHNLLTQTFLDVNGWLYFLLLPIILSGINSNHILKNIFSLLLSAITYVSLKTLFLYILFIHQFNLNLFPIYKWIRDSGVGEITKITDSFYRIFFQSHLYLIIGLIFLFLLLIFSKQLNINKKLSIYILSIITLASLLISFSRSFWLGLLFSILVLFIIYIILEKSKLLKIFSTFTPIIFIFLISVFLINILSFDFSGNLKNRLNNSINEPAASSRISQLKPLFKGTLYKPILGSGYGKTLTYYSQDPRILENSPSGIYTTYAFEWGYLDIWLKLGIFGLLAYFYLLYKILVKSYKLISNNTIYFWLLLSILALIITNLFSPYLNHPLGIGFIILATVIINYLNEPGTKKIEY